MKTLIIGYTRTDRQNNYVPAMDGYRAGAPQKGVKIKVDDSGLGALTGEEWAEAVYTATNAPEEVVRQSAPAVAVLAALVELVSNGEKIRALCKGDTVMVVEDDDARWACSGVGWERHTPWVITPQDEMEAARLTDNLGFLVTPEQVAKDRTAQQAVAKIALDESQGDTA